MKIAMDNKKFINAVTERLNKRVKEKLDKDGTILEDEIYDIFKEEAGLKVYAIPGVHNDILKNYSISQVYPSIFHLPISWDADFRRAADEIKRRYNNVR